ncbi:MAG: DUF7002 family protein [Phycisphaerales bacterium]
MQIHEYLRLRPTLYHLTAASNLAHIQQEQRLYPAADLFAKANRADLLHSRRRQNVAVDVGGARRIIRDQAPLHEGNILFQDGMAFGEFIAYVNQHVFFWPGMSGGPIDYGRRHFGRYASEDCAVLVIDGHALLEANAECVPMFSRYNSGSPRCSGGKKSPRGRDTFVSAERFSQTPGRVIETVFAAPVTLPQGEWEVRSHREFI